MFAKYLVWTFCCLCAIVLIPSTTCDCNEFVCGSVVSKCLLIQSCQCNLTDCFCCRDCFKCLGRLYTECCSCLEMCPKNNETFTAMAPKSQIGEFDGVPELFDSLTAEDIDDEWKTIRFPIHQSLGDNQHMFLGKFAFDDYVDKETPNCTVIYLNTCTTNEKCDGYCASMGAKSYRWFHNGCCECVGGSCFNYGINESHCSSCPEEQLIAVDIRDRTENDEPDFVGVDEDDLIWDYDEEDDIPK